MSLVVDSGSSAANLASMADHMRELVSCDGFAVRADGETVLSGSAPSSDEVAGLVGYLDRAAAGRIVAADELGALHPPARAYAERAAGVLAIPISRAPGDYLMLFRREIVRGRCAPWTEPERRAADALRLTVLEVVLRLTGVAARGRETAKQRQDVLIAELNHRVRNILGLIRGLISQSRSGATDIEGFAAAIGGRVQALARAHGQITEGNWGPRSLRTLVTTEAAAFLNGGADRVGLEGPDVLLRPEAFATIALVAHELVTNAAK